MRKIAIFHELDFGGARRTVYEFAKRLNKIVYVDIYYVDSKEDKEIRTIAKNVFFYSYVPKSWNGNNWKARLYKDTVELIKLYALHKKIAQVIKSRKYDYIFVNPSKYTQAPFILRFLKNSIYYCQEPLRIVYDPLISNISNIKFPKNVYEFISRKIRKLIDKENIDTAGRILCNSIFSKEFIEKSYKKQATVCYLGVNSDLFKPQEANKSIDVLSIGNKDEGHKLLAEAFKQFKIKPKIKEIFRGQHELKVSDRELVEIYNKSKLLVALNRYEPFGLIPLEAMSCGLPVIALNEGGYKESVIDNKTGFLIPGDSSVLYGKIRMLVDDEDIRNKMGKNARENILINWTWDGGVERFLKIINYGK